MKCDFCSGQDIRWRYPARPHIMSNVGVVTDKGLEFVVTGGSADDWAACDECHALIARADRDALLERSVETYGSSPIPRATLRQIIRQIHDNFWAAREGAPAPIEIQEAP